MGDQTKITFFAKNQLISLNCIGASAFQKILAYRRPLNVLKWADKSTNTKKIYIFCLVEFIVNEVVVVVYVVIVVVVGVFFKVYIVVAVFIVVIFFVLSVLWPSLS